MLFADYAPKFKSYPKPVAYPQWVSGYDEMIVHTRGVKPDTLLNIRRPYEPEEIKTYRINNYRPITKDPINRAIQNAQRIFGRAAVQVDIASETDEALSEIKPLGIDFMSYFHQSVIRRMFEDANGLLIWWPDGEGLTNPSVPVDVQEILVLSKNIVHFDSDVCTFLADEKQPNGKNVWYTICHDGYFKIYEGEKTGQYTFAQHYSETFEGDLPVIILGGNLTSVTVGNRDVLYYDSFFSIYNAFANEAITQFSDHQAIMVTSAYPIREMEALPCPNERGGCRDGYVVVEGKRTTCGTCEGRGHLIPSTPYGVIVKPKAEGVNPQQTTAPALRYISPEVGIIEYGGRHWESLLKRAEKALNLLFVDEAQSGVAKEIDREDKLASLDVIGANVFLNIIKRSIEIIQKLRFIDATVDIILPDTFKVKTDSELVEDLSTLRSGEAPDFLLREKAKELIRKQYGQNRWQSKISEFIFAFDPLFHLSSKQKADLLAASAITEEQYANSLHLPSVIDRIANANESEFMDWDYARIAQLVTESLAAIPRPSRAIFAANGFE